MLPDILRQYIEDTESAVKSLENMTYLGYRYHFQDDQNKLVFRYDNTPHFSKLDSFPHHKHLADKVISSKKPSPRNAILEATKKIANG